MSLYRQDIIDLYKNPLNSGELPNANVTHSGANLLCGDHVRIYIKLSKNSAKIDDVSFVGEGCAISIASASLVTEEAKGKNVSDVVTMTPQDVFELLGLNLGPARTKCAVLVLETLQEGLKNFIKKS